ncbi:hypothetical protein M9434_007115 [Picochlorum sp. BPE23]|nr:hypothetical protein M9434_007115 [Picochlorum sp. BPE23]
MGSNGDNVFERFAFGSRPTRCSPGDNKKPKEKHCSTSSETKGSYEGHSDTTQKHGFPRVLYKSDCVNDGKAAPIALRLLIVGHNPSEASWNRGHYYANPNNWMWRILQETAIVDTDTVMSCEQDVQMPRLYGIGFTDVGGGVQGTHSSTFSGKHIYENWRGPFYNTLREICENTCEEIECCCSACGCPSLLAFAGMKQFVQLFESRKRKKGRDRDGNEERLNQDRKVTLASQNRGMGSPFHIRRSGNDSAC